MFGHQYVELEKRQKYLHVEIDVLWQSKVMDVEYAKSSRLICQSRFTALQRQAIILLFDIFSGISLNSMWSGNFSLGFETIKLSAQSDSYYRPPWAVVCYYRPSWVLDFYYRPSWATAFWDWITDLTVRPPPQSAILTTHLESSAAVPRDSPHLTRKVQCQICLICEFLARFIPQYIKYFASLLCLLASLWSPETCSQLQKRVCICCLWTVLSTFEPLLMSCSCPQINDIRQYHQCSAKNSEGLRTNEHLRISKH